MKQINKTYKRRFVEDDLCVRNGFEYGKEEIKMKCAICGKETSVTCLCGFCPSCISWKGHQGCHDEIRNREAERKEKAKKEVSTK